MKYNPRINDAMANVPALRDLHPFAPDHAAQGALAVMWELERALASLFGMAAFSLNPAAGAHAELAALLIAKAYFKQKGEPQRNVVIVPDTAHGTNPASAAMVGYKVLSLKSDARGRVDPDEMRKVVGPDTAVCMMTNPNTLGLFEPRIHEVSDVVHDAGGLMYYDGANANALMGNTRPGDMGFDLMHLNLHKTFTIPHGGGGAGAGPVGVAAHLVRSCPTPVVRAYERRRQPSEATAGATDRGLTFRARLRAARRDRHDALVLVELRPHGARAGLHLRQRRRRPDHGLASWRCSTRTTSARRSATWSTCRTTRSTGTSSSPRRSAQTRDRRARARPRPRRCSTAATTRRRSTFR